MKSRPVVIAADAEVQLRAIRSWWRENRPGAPDLFDRELDATIATVAKVPHAFPTFRQETGENIRRALLPRSRYAIYFAIHPDAVLIVALWHTARGGGPPLE